MAKSKTGILEAMQGLMADPAYDETAKRMNIIHQKPADSQQPPSPTLHVVSPVPSIVPHALPDTSKSIISLNEVTKKTTRQKAFNKIGTTTSDATVSNITLTDASASDDISSVATPSDVFTSDGVLSDDDLSNAIKLDAFSTGSKASHENLLDGHQDDVSTDYTETTDVHITSHDITSNERPASHVVASDKQTEIRQTAEQPTVVPINLSQATIERLTQSRNTTERTIYHDPIIDLTPRQGAVLYYLLQTPDFICRRNDVSRDLKIPVPTIRDTIQLLTRKGFITKPTKFVYKNWQGFTYQIADEQLCARFLKARGGEFENLAQRQTLIPPTNQNQLQPTVDVITSHITSPSSSSFLENKTTTTKGPAGVKILSGAIGAYWEEEGLGEKQAQKWCEQFEVEPNVMRLQLEWCRFDLEENGKRDEVKKDKISFFFSRLRTTGGGYPRPVNYKSPVEIRAEAIEQDLLKEREAQERLIAAEDELKFQQILSNPDSVAYQSLLKQTNEFDREMGGTVLVNILRGIFQKGRGGEGALIA